MKPQGLNLKSAVRCGNLFRPVTVQLSPRDGSIRLSTTKFPTTWQMNGRIRVCVHVLQQHVAAVNAVKLEGRKWEVAQGIIRLEIACRYGGDGRWKYSKTLNYTYKQKHTYTNWRSWWPERRGGNQRAVRHDTTDDQNQEVQFAYLWCAATCSAHAQGKWQGYEDVSSNHLSHSDTFTNMYIDTHTHTDTWSQNSHSFPWFSWHTTHHSIGEKRGWRRVVIYISEKAPVRMCVWERQRSTFTPPVWNAVWEQHLKITRIKERNEV